MKNLTELTEWQALREHQRHIAQQHMRDWFAADAARFSRFTLQTDLLLLDYSRNRITPTTINLLCELVQAIGLRKKIEALFLGHPINITENRPALHTALRDKNHTSIIVDGKNIAPMIVATQQKMRSFVTQIHTQTWRGVTGKPIEHVVNIGIGGSYLGPMMSIHALQAYAVAKLQFHFVSTVDKDHLNEVLQQINPETTLFIISSKSFSTLETITNARTMLAWMQHKLGRDAVNHHFIAITADAEKALAFGIPSENIFSVWDWVGGRYSIWSAMGLPLMLMIGPNHFDHFLEGAYRMDEHFRQADFAHNMPVLLALLGIWYMNFFGAGVQAVIPYAYRLRFLIPYLQQAEMESNGKSINLNGMGIDYATSPVIFGEEGCNGQHAYHQLLHQGQHLIPVDFILVAKCTDKDATHQNILLASALSQAQALMQGKTLAEAKQDLTANCLTEHASQLAKHASIPGNRPSNILCLERLTPQHLGALLALYEHKIFVQGAIWGINSFDQWGVELGKQLLPTILRHVQGDPLQDHIDSATAGWINYFRAIQGSS